MIVAPISSAIDRIPPNNLEAEQALLGSILVDRDMMDVVAEIVEPGDFYASLHESIYLALYALYERREPLDKVALAEELRSRGMLDKVGGLAYLGSLMDTVPTAASAEHYARIVRDKARLRELIDAGTEINRLGYESEHDAAGAIAHAANRIATISGHEAGRAGWAAISAAQIAHDGVPEVPEDIAGLLQATDAPALVFGPPESFKSLLAIHAMICMVTGDPFLGAFAVRKRPFGILVNLDGGRAATMRRLLRMTDDPRVFMVSPDRWDASEFRRLLERFRSAYVVVDCLADAMVLPPGVDPAEATRSFLRDLRHVYEDHDCGGMILDHAKRAAGARGGVDYYGSVQKRATVRQMWALERLVDEAGTPLNQTRVVCDKMSESERFLPFVADFDFDASPIRCSLAGVGAAAPAKLTAADRHRRELLDIIRKHPEGATRADLGTGEYGNGERRRALAALRAEGKIDSIGTRPVRFVIAAGREAGQTPGQQRDEHDDAQDSLVNDRANRPAAHDTDEGEAGPGLYRARFPSPIGPGPLGPLVIDEHDGGVDALFGGAR
jgi:hypothetical protein